MTTNTGEKGAIAASAMGAVGSVNGSGGSLAAEAEARALGERVGVKTTASPERERRSWFSRVVGSYMKRHQRRTAAKKASIARGEIPKKKIDARPAPERASSAIRWACIKSAITGATAGAISTTATILTAETEGLAGFIAVPFAAATIGGEMIYRSFVHVDLTCDLAEIFEVKFDAENEADLWRLYALAFGTDDHEEGTTDPGKELVHSVTHTEGEQVGEKIGSRVLGESVMRNIVPVFGIFSSAVTNYVLTKRLGDTVRRAMRYQRAMDDTFETWTGACAAHIDLLIEGMWFVFTADGRMSPEEVTCLAKLLDKLDKVQRHAVMERFIDDEIDFLERITAEIPVDMRDAFLHALEVGAAVDKIVGLPEKKILRRVAHHLDLEFDMARVEKMIKQFEEEGVLADPPKA